MAQSMFAEKSSPEEWEKRGDEIMQRSLYDVAAKCYAMAGATHKQNIAIAHQRALKASHLRAQPRQMREAFLKAAILFLECHKELVPSSSTLALRFNLVTKAGRCLQNARENHLAAMVFEKNGQVMSSGRFFTCFYLVQTCLVYAIGVENYSFEAQTTHLHLHYTNYAKMTLFWLIFLIIIIILVIIMIFI